MAVNPYTPDGSVITAAPVSLNALYLALATTLGNSTYWGIGDPRSQVNVPLVNLTEYKWFIDTGSGIVYNFAGGAWGVTGQLNLATGGVGGTTVTPTNTYYEYTQLLPSNLTTVPHNLGKWPSARLRDSSYQNIEGRIIDIDVNNIQVSFDVPPLQWSLICTI